MQHAYMELVEFQELDKRIEEIYHESLDLQKCINDINSRNNKTFNWSTGIWRAERFVAS